MLYIFVIKIIANYFMVSRTSTRVIFSDTVLRLHFLPHAETVIAVIKVTRIIKLFITNPPSNFYVFETISCVELSPVFLNSNFMGSKNLE